MYNHFHHSRLSSDNLEKRLLFAAENPNTELESGTSASANENEILDGVPEKNDKVAETASWFGRRLKATIDFPGHFVDHSWGAAQGLGVIGEGTYDWAKGNTLAVWDGVKILGRTGTEIGKEVLRVPLDPIKGVIGNTREKFGKLFSTQDTTLANMWWKKPAQAVNALISPATGLLKGSKDLVAGRNKEDPNILARSFNTLRGDQRSGIVGIANGTKDLLYQTFINGPIKTQWPALTMGSKAIIANTRNLAARAIDTGLPAPIMAAYGLVPWYVATPTALYSETLTDSLLARIKPINNTNESGFNSQNFANKHLSYPPEIAKRASNDDSTPPSQRAA